MYTNLSTRIVVGEISITTPFNTTWMPGCPRVKRWLCFLPNCFLTICTLTVIRKSANQMTTVPLAICVTAPSLVAWSHVNAPSLRIPVIIPDNMTLLSMLDYWHYLRAFICYLWWCSRGKLWNYSIFLFICTSNWFYLSYSRVALGVVVQILHIHLYNH